MKKILFLMGVFVTCFLLVGCQKKVQVDFGKVSEITVEELVTKFSKVGEDNSKDNNTDKNEEWSYSVRDDMYWYKLGDGIYFVVSPMEYQKDKTKEVVKMSRLYVEKENANNDSVTNYLKNLIKANNEELTSEEIDSLIKNAKKYTKDKVTANNGKGISVGYLDTDTHFEYQVIRIYK